jgi:hypothetical protein
MAASRLAAARLARPQGVSRALNGDQRTGWPWLSAHHRRRSQRQDLALFVQGSKAPTN